MSPSRPTAPHSTSRILRFAVSLAAALALTPLRGPALAAAPVGFADVAEQALPAYVDVLVRPKSAPTTRPGHQAQGQPPQGPFDQFFRDFFDQVPQQGQERNVGAQGSGFIVDKSGVIVTNNHVVEDADQITIVMHDGVRLVAKLLATDARADLAVLKVDAGRDLPSLRWADSDTARVGDWILAIGNPYGMGGTVTAGIISARARNIGATQFDNLIQTEIGRAHV